MLLRPPYSVLLGGAPPSAIAGLFAGSSNPGAWLKSSGLSAPAWLDSSGNNHDMVQATASFQPAVQVSSGLNEAVFDGVDNFMVQKHSATVAMASAVNLPDAAGSHAGKGFTCTGMCRDSTDGTLWIANHGKGRETDPAYASSIVHLSADGTTIIAEYELDADLGITGATSAQGICEVTPDNTIAFFHLGDNKVYVVNKDGTGCAESALGAIANTNGIAYDSSLDYFVLGVSSTARWYNRSTGALVQSRSMPGVSADQLSYDAARNWLWYTSGANGSPGSLQAIDAATNWSSVVADLTLTEANAIEGVIVEGNTILIANDGYYHAATPALNRLLTFTHRIAQPLKLDTRFQMAFIFRFPAQQATSSRCLISFGDPLGTGAEGGFGIWSPINTYTTLRFFHRNSLRDLTVPAMSTRRVVFLDVDLPNNAFSLWIDGALIANSTFPAANTPATIRKRLYLGARQNTENGSVFFNAEVRELLWLEGTAMLNQRQRVEAELLRRAA